VLCAFVEVPAHHEHPGDGQTVRIRVARQKARGFPTGRAVFQLAGGPGGASVWQSGAIPRRFAKLLDQFDLVYMDQRGSGGSGYLGCSSGYPSNATEWVRCADEHRSDDLDHSLTVDAADDLDAVRERLGYSKIYFRGGSYGTRLGLEYVRRHEAHVVAGVLDGLDPLDLDVLGLSIGATDRGVARLLRDCSSSPACRAVAPDLRSDLESRRAAVKAHPRPILAGATPAVEDERTFLDTLAVALFDASQYFKLPRALHAAATGDMTGWNEILSDGYGDEVTGRVAVPNESVAPLRLPAQRGGGPSYVSPGTYVAVTCAEDFASSEGLQALRARAAAAVWGVGDSLDLAEACSAWHVTQVPASVRRPVASRAKLLLLNGDLDLDTFPEWGAHVAQTLPASTNVTVPFATHSTMSVPCVADIIQAFVAADGDIAQVDMSCLQRLSPPPW
jgi:pimeloyl-ACP methyl ester carboxylesterase